VDEKRMDNMRISKALRKINTKNRPKRETWLGIYEHRFGTDYVLLDHEPAPMELEEYWKNEYEAERDDEYIGYSGPLSFIGEK